MFQRLLNLFFPKHSLTGNEGTWITEDERKRMKLYPIRLDRQLLRKKEIKNLDCLIAAGSYQASPLLRKAIKTFKYGRIADLGPDLAKKIVDCLPGLLLLPEKYRNASSIAICPVQLHWTRAFQRGFNQAEILAEHIGKQKKWHIQNLVKRSKATGHQAWRNREERLIALNNAFVCVSDTPPPCVLLVDDISSTGATLDTCAKALKSAGAKHIVGLVVAYG